MPFFIILNLAASALSYLHSPYLALLLDDRVVVGASLLAVASGLAGCFGKLSSVSWLDSVACCGLIIWYACWPPEFSVDAPMFTGIPVYFAVLASWLGWALVSRASRFDQETRQTVLHLQRLIRFDTHWVAALMLISLAFPEHYLSYPLLTTLFIVRASLHLCFESVRATASD